MGSRLQSETTEPTGLTFTLLEEITENFSEERKLGAGAYGEVYMARRKNGEEIAVKKLYNNGPGLDYVQFQNEFNNLMCLQHQNIVRLVDYCYETQHKHTRFDGKLVFAETINRALCIEYMPNGSLRKHLSDESEGLDWHTRYKIIKGTCDGLKYLHEELKPPMYHLDIKPDNILLDKNMEPKLADFGLSRLFGEDKTHITKSYMGTPRYMPPEFIEKHVISKKSDIFSLGVVIVEIVAGPKGYSKSPDMPSQEFIDLVHGNWRKRLQITWSGTSLEAYCQQVKTCIEIALNCGEYDRHKRPDIVDIFNKLNEMEIVISQLRNDNESAMGKLIMTDLLRKIYEKTYVRSVDMHPTEPWIMTTQDDQYVHILDYQAQEEKSFKITTSTSYVSSAQFVPRMQWIVAGDSDGAIHVYSYDTVKEIRILIKHSDSVRSLAVHETEPYVLSASNDGEVHLWDYEKDWELIKTFKMHAKTVPGVAFNRKDTTTFATNDGHDIKIWDLHSYECKLTLSEHSKAVTCLAYFNRGDELFLITGSYDDTAKIWDCHTGRCVETLEDHEGSVYAVCSYPDLPILITGSTDGSVRLWDSTTYRLKGRLDLELKRVRVLRCLKDSTMIAVGCELGLAMVEINMIMGKGLKRPYE